MLKRRDILLGSMALCATSGMVHAAKPRFFSANGLALRGYDPVAYFTEGRPMEGLAAHSLNWQGTAWRFATPEHLAAFERDPEGFAPQYGGYCAWAVSRNYTASTVPEAWHIHEGRLFLNYSLGVRKRWRRDVPGNVAKGDANWPAVLTG